MNSRRTLWSRWKAFAQRAAEVQASVLFFLLYYIAIVPMGLLRLGGPSALRRSRSASPAWTDHDRSPVDLRSSRRQY
jgi:hypothetical protein